METNPLQAVPGPATRPVPRPVRVPLGVAHTPAYPEVDLTNCDREPIHVPGAIQPHGVLLSLDAGLRNVVSWSANTRAALGVEPTGATLAELIGVLAAAQVTDRVAADLPSEPLVLTLPRSAGTLAQADVDVHLFRSGSRIVVELEPLVTTGAAPLSYASARAPMARLASAGSLSELADHLSREVRELLGFDRVMVYRFDPRWNGEVIAEQRREDLNPFLGLHYPATDIPAQARRLYTVNWTRLIVDIGYTPVPLEPILDPATGAPLDLSFSRLRSVSPIHVEYLGHMGVTASMSISLVVNNQLWGLIACHHYSGPHRPAQDARAASEFLAQVASQMIGEREQSDRREAALRARTVLTDMVNRVTASERNPLVSLIEDPELLDVMGAGGAAIAYDDGFLTAGQVPSEKQLRAISAALADPDDHVTYTDNVALLTPELGADPVVTQHAAGALRVGSEPDRWILWLRPEQERTVDWGGDPRNKEVAAAEGPEVRLSPRRSFEKWREVVRGVALPWDPWQVEAADALAGQVTSLQLSRAREHVLVAEAVQASVVLGEVPRLDGLEVAARYLPAATLQMGGDWWDAFEVSPGRAVLVLGDVAGHGVEAASTMVQLRTALRAYLYAGAGPAVALDQLDALMRNVLPDRFATALVACVDLATGQVDLAGAGHLPPLLVTPEGTVDLEIDARPLLGFEAVGAPTTTFLLEPGQTLLLFSDGLVERRGVDMDERTDVVRGLARYAPAEPIDGWTDEIMTIRDGTEDDDTTILAVRRPLSSRPAVGTPSP
ncbi:SpoIIE family protein phosphatase [Nocardioides zeae]|uniref:SpoIIE family protein phosphatase n=1 Tax=Nocardioides imazamoxiresistens TaxID=3231893 RepID=A0ABU3PYA6_9ACTN|nr:SpoIIE family protein phosphatase [Nocardioides zeae]MDT9594228.1 SpoIIE family protein phosphatase [Nocardioides zeae]